VEQKIQQEVGVSNPAQACVQVVLIDDNEAFVYFVRDILTRQCPGRFVLRSAGSLAEGKQLLHGGHTDILLLDLGLPDSGGFATFTAAQAVAPELPIVILSCLDDSELAIRAVRDGAQDYIMKDKVDRDLLVRAIRYALERSQSKHALRQLSVRLLQLQDDERRRIARELHDTTAQTLAAVAMNLSLLDEWSPDLSGKARELLKETEGYAQECSRELRTMSYLLHPPLLDDLGLAGAIRQYADGFARRSGIRVDLELPDDGWDLPRALSLALFRVLQESLANIHRHSGSRTASIRLAEADQSLRMEVEDRGCGIAASGAETIEADSPGLGVGIPGMRERLHQLGGNLTIESDSHGTLVRAIVSL
jgi:signal transduction histidine kinase